MAKKSEFAVATIGPSVPDALTALRKKLQGLREISETSYKTGGSGMVSPFPNSIQSETDIAVLIKMHSSVFGKSKAYDSSQSRLSEIARGPISAPPFKENGQTLENIEEDIALRIKVLNITEEKQQLEALLKEAEGFLSEGDKFKMFQQRLAAKLGLSVED